MYKDVVITQAGANPTSIKVNTGWAVRFVNNDSLKLNIDIKGPSSLVSVGADKILYSPIFTQSGTYKFSDKTNTNISGEIVVEGANISSQSSSGPATAAPTQAIPQGTLFVTSDGVAPRQINVKIGNALKIVNNTDRDSTVKMSGKLNNDVLVPARKTISTVVFGNGGQIKAWLNNNSENIAIIDIK